MQKKERFPDQLLPSLASAAGGADTEASALFEAVLSDDNILGKIMAIADFGAAHGEPTCPAARFACVSKQWNRVYHSRHVPLLTNELKRIPGWTIQEDTSVLPSNPSGSAETIADTWVCPPNGPRRPAWWTSHFSFNGGQWTGEYMHDSTGGPFPLSPGWPAPCLMVSFPRPVKVRAIAFAARNRPRRVRLSTVSPAGTHQEQMELAIPPPSVWDRPEIGLSRPPIPSPHYMELVALHLPQGTPPSEIVLSRNSALPVVLPQALPPCEVIAISILESHERGWVGINNLALFE